MGMDEQLRRKLILFKEENRYSNQDVADMIKPCSGQSVGRWVVNKDSYISEENEIKLRELLKDVNIGSQGIDNTERLRNIIFSKSMKKGLSFKDIAEKMGTIISAEELEILLSDNGAEFTPKTLSSLCAVLDITKNELPISIEDQEKLYINAMKADMLLTEVPIFPLRVYNKCENIHDLFGDKQKAEELIWVTGLKLDKKNKYIGVRSPVNDLENGIFADDIIILCDDEFHPVGNYVAANINNKLLIGQITQDDKLFSENSSFKLTTFDWSDVPVNNYSYILKVAKIIRDLQ